MSEQIDTSDCLDKMKDIPDGQQICGCVICQVKYFTNHLFCDIIINIKEKRDIMNEHKIIELYTIEKMTLRMIAKEMVPDHYRIKRILVKNVKMSRLRKKLELEKPFTDEHKAKISKTQKEEKLVSEGKRCPENLSLKYELLI